MKTKYNVIYKSAIFLFLCLCLGVGTAVAQEPMKITGRVNVVNKSAGDNNMLRIDTIRQMVYYGAFRDIESANKAKVSIEASRNKSMTAEEFRNFCMKNGLRFPTKGNGTFTTTVMPGMVLLATTKNGDMPEKITSEFVVTEGKTHYTIEIGTKDLIGGGTTGKKKVVKGTPFVTGDGTVLFPISLSIPKDSIKKSTRIIVQPYALDCMNEDTMSYLMPIVYEGDNYHILQDKRMAFNYFGNDTLAPSYRASVIKGFQDVDPDKTIDERLSRDYLKLEKQRADKAENTKKDSVVLTNLNEIFLDTVSNEYIVNATIKYILPDRKRMCRGPFVCALEDYHRVYYKKAYPGTCLVNRPFKFLDFSAGIPDMELKTEFYEEAESQFQKVNDKLDLRFLQGKAELAQDSINEIESERMANILSDQEGLLKSSVTITATSSPEGSDRINRELAQKRAVAARHYVARYLRGVSPKTETKLYKWDDVADRLASEGKRVEAQTVRDIIAANGSNKVALDRALRQLDFYESVIGPILSSMRVMSYTYMFEKHHVLTETEVVESYYKYKKDYLSGKNTLSSGDYYNLYKNIEDSLELDTITIMAYNHLKKKGFTLEKLYEERIAPYVLNRMARKLLDSGTPDTLMLMPFIDEPVSDTIFDKRLNQVVKKLDGLEVCMNFQDILITQAMNYYQMQMFPRAHKYIEWIKAMSNNPPAALNKIQMYMDLMTYFSSDENNPKFVRAKDSVLNSSPDNKAILYTEVPEWRISFDDTNNLLDMMDDSNPKKWYLKGMLWASKAEVLDGEPDLSGYYPKEDSGFRILSAEEENALIMKGGDAFDNYEQQKKEYLEAHKDDPAEDGALKESVDISGIKHYLAYFHHSFQIGGPSFRKYYFNEGRVDEELRKKHKYLKKDFAAYEELFTLLKARDDENRASLLGEGDEEADNALNGENVPASTSVMTDNNVETEKQNDDATSSTTATGNEKEETKE